MFFPVFNLPFSAMAVRKLTHFKYFYHDNFRVVRIHSLVHEKKQCVLLLKCFVITHNSIIFDYVLFTFSNLLFFYLVTERMTQGRTDCKTNLVLSVHHCNFYITMQVILDKLMNVILDMQNRLNQLYSPRETGPSKASSGQTRVLHQASSGQTRVLHQSK